MPDRYAVFGHPVAHSKSPVIHAAFARATGQSIDYDKQQVAIDDFEQAVAGFFAGGGKGLNITVPFKQRAFALAEQCSERAQSAGAVNTLYLRDGVLIGDNTDGAGLLRDLQHYLGWPLKQQRILLLGAGGASRGVLLPLLQAQPAELVVANRTVHKAQTLVADFARTWIPAESVLRACSFDEMAEQAPFDVIINGTAASLAGSVPDIPETIVTGSRCYDMAYSDVETAFQRWVLACGAQAAVDGLGMLVEQAAESFYLWRGVRPETDAVRRMLRA